MANALVVIVAFFLWVLADYVFVKGGSRPEDQYPCPYLQYSFPVIVFGLNWLIFKPAPVSMRILVCAMLSLFLSLVGLGLIWIPGIWFHFYFGGKL